tara:strand:+ start:183 stop:386 length:204 start_codon:yes stop_codon:yes gene_type:complete
VFGNYWHCNPKIEGCHKDFVVKKTKEIWEKDMKDKQKVIKHSFNYKIIWETQFGEFDDSNLMKEVLS